MNRRLIKAFSKILELLGRVLYFVGAAVLFILYFSLREIGKISDSGSLWQTIGIFLIIIIISAVIVGIGRYLVVLGKKITAKMKNADLNTELDNPYFQPVLYLRSFNEDKKTSKTSSLSYGNYEIDLLSTEEEQLSKAISDIGPMVAIGIPGEKLPTLGAARVYTDDESWQALVNKILLKSKLVILKVGSTEGFRWEIGHTLQNAKPEQTVFLIPNDKALYDDFCSHLSKFIKHDLPQFEYGYNEKFTIGSIMYFTQDWKPHLVKLKGFYNRRSKSNPLKPIIRLALKPVYENIGVKWRRQPISLSYIFFFVFMLLIIGFDSILPFNMTYSSKGEIVQSFILMYSILLFLLFFLVMFGIGFIRQLKAYKKYEESLTNINKIDVVKNYSDLVNELESTLEGYFAYNLKNASTEKFYNPSSMSIDEMYNSRVTDYCRSSFECSYNNEVLLEKIKQYSSLNDGRIINSISLPGTTIVFYNKRKFDKVHIINVTSTLSESQKIIVETTVLIKSKGSKKISKKFREYLIG